MNTHTVPIAEQSKLMVVVTFLCAIGITLCMGMSPVILKFSLSHFPPFLAVLMRMSAMAIILLPFAMKHRPKRMGTVWLLSILLFSAYYTFLTLGLKNINSGIASILIKLDVPICAILAIIFFKENFVFKQFVGIIIAMFGVYYIIEQPNIMPELKSCFLVLGATVSYSLSIILTKYLKDEKNNDIDSMGSLIIYSSNAFVNLII